MSAIPYISQLHDRWTRYTIENDFFISDVGLC